MPAPDVRPAILLAAIKQGHADDNARTVEADHLAPEIVGRFGLEHRVGENRIERR